MIGLFSSSKSSPSYYCIMDPMASSHTVGSRTGRRLLIMFFAFVLVRHSIVAVAVASDSGNLQGLGEVSQDSSLRLGIRAEQAGRNDLLYRIGLEGTSQANFRPPAIGMRRVEGWRRILGDISIPEMRPTPSVSPVVDDEFRRSLLTGRTSPPPLGPLLNIVIRGNSQDGEDAFLRQALVADETYPMVHWASLIVNKLKHLGRVINRSSLGFRIRLPRSLSLREKVEHGDQHLRSISGRIVVPDADRTSPDTVKSETMSISLQEKIHVEKPRFRRRSLLQGDISPPGMWPDSDSDDESQLSESVLLRRRRLMNM